MAYHNAMILLASPSRTTLRVITSVYIRHHEALVGRTIATEVDDRLEV